FSFFFSSRRRHTRFSRDWSSDVCSSDLVELTERDKAILDFERSWWTQPGPKEAAIVERFELSATRYYQILNELLETPEAYDHDRSEERRVGKEWKLGR